MKNGLLFRADAGAAIGTGHVMRCLALAQAWEDAGGRAAFACAELPSGLADRLEREGLARHRLDVAVGSDADAGATIELARRTGAIWVVVDGYRFQPDYYEAVGQVGLKVMAIDDTAHLARYPVDLLLNQNFGAPAELYAGKLSADADLLLGPAYSLLRREFRRDRPVRAPLAGRAPRLLVSLGGADDENFTLQVLRRLADLGWPGEVLVVAGAANRHVGLLAEFVAHAPFRCELRQNAEDMAALMAWADVGITAGGSTVWELAARRLPALVGAVSPDQFALLPALRSLPGFSAGPMARLLEADLVGELAALCAAAHEFTDFDPNGAPRVAARLASNRATALSAS